MLVRPRPFVPPPLPVQLWRLLWRPAAGVALVLRSQPDLPRVAVGLFAAGLVQVLAASLFGRAEWRNSYFLLHAIVTLPAAWLGSALLLWAGARLLGAAPRLRPTLQVTGVAMCAGPFMALPVVRLVFCAWLATVSYQTARQLYGLSGWRAAAAAALAPGALAALGLTLHV